MDLKSMTQDELAALCIRLGGKPYFAPYIFSFIHCRGIASAEEITPLSKAFRAALLRESHISQLSLVERSDDPDGTVKMLFELADGCRIESVVLTNSSRRTLCISTQAGCSRKCEFCATGGLSFRRNLTAGEIVDQGIQANRLTGRIANVVYMGMGEPFDNYEQTIRSVRLLNSADGLNIGARHITLSTCGVTAGIRSLAEERLGVRLAVSLHAADDETRKMMMPGLRRQT
ncbi:MAG TPA: radical SAM protein, partial [Sedimentisphaerales bacterium]|nr:radical SAM protein [Sedimentisphaerales bacterium]